ncbi:MAG: signal peptidase I [Dehalococcoidia bacterium]|nr:signal peptidase I [Dehalococcoidia bacterium]
MEHRRRLVASLSSAFTLIAVIAAWIAFAPPQLGGRTSYVIVSGNSMEPGMHRGDLAIVRKQDAYVVGEVVTYRHPQIGPVIHRVIDTDGSRFVFQGDNNDFIDPYRPVQAEMIGELWIHVPGAGSWLTRFHSPVYIAGLLFVAFASLGGGTAAVRATRGHRRKQHRKPAPSGAGTRGAPSMNPLLRDWQDTLSILAAAALGLGVLAWVAFNRPTTHEVPADTPYSQSGEFQYTAAAEDGRIYDTGEATSGEPVYRRLSDAVAFRFTYAFEGADASGIGGIYHLVAELGDQSGWRRTIDLTPETAFSGKEFTAEGVLSLPQAQELIAILETQSGVKNDRYSVTITPRVEVSGRIAGTPFEDTFSTAALAMELDDVQLRLARGASTDPLDQLTPKAEGNVSTRVERANTIGLLVVDLPVAAARMLSLAGLGLVLMLSGAFVIALVNQRNEAGMGGSEKLKSPLVMVRGKVPAVRMRVVDVTSLEDLGRIAEQSGAVVLQEARPGFHAYFVHDGELTYRFQAMGMPDIPPAQSRTQGAA